MLLIELEKKDSTSSLTKSNAELSEPASNTSSHKTAQNESSDSESAGNALDIMQSDMSTTLDDAILRISGTKMRVSSKHLILASKYFR